MKTADLKIVENTELHKIQIFFPGKPDEDTRVVLKNRGFRWSPKDGAWQRALNDNGRYAKDRVMEKLERMEAMKDEPKRD